MAKKWCFRFSVENTPVICFSNKKMNPSMNIKAYGHQLE